MNTIKELEKARDLLIKSADNYEECYNILTNVLKQTKEIYKMIDKMQGDYKSEVVKKILLNGQQTIATKNY